ncbi:MAG: DUF2332 family protein [Candidatus Dormibacteria bacterium]
MWPDQGERFGALESALEIARYVPAAVDKADGAVWLAVQLAEPRDDVTTVVYHSVVLQYMGEVERDAFNDVMAEAGARATEKAPLARLSFEPGGTGRAHVELTIWPGMPRTLVATSGYHGRPVRWLQEAERGGQGPGFY